MSTYSKTVIRGSEKYPDIFGYAVFVPYFGKTMATFSVYGLPVGEGCSYKVFDMHIHSGGQCSGNADDPFADAESHYDKGSCPHPCHSGDMPPLFPDKSGTAQLAFVTDRFTPDEIMGRTVIIHAMPDDLHTQPSGNSGEKIACGVIEKLG